MTSEEPYLAVFMRVEEESDGKSYPCEENPPTGLYNRTQLNVARLGSMDRHRRRLQLQQPQMGVENPKYAHKRLKNRFAV
jgi:hypothetical protein